MQLAIVPAGDQWRVIKRIMFDELQKLVKVREELARGSARSNYWWPRNSTSTKKAFQNIFESLHEETKALLHGNYYDQAKFVYLHALENGWLFMIRL